MQKIATKIILIVTIICVSAYIGIFIGRVSVSSPFESKSNVVTPDNDRFTINLNTADFNTLMDLPGMDAVLAKEIISYRQTYGEFISVKELQNLPHMTDTLYTQIKDLVHIGGTQ